MSRWCSPRWRTRPTAARGIASPSMAWVWGMITGYSGRTTSSGRATSTRSPRPRSRPATTRRRAGRSTTCGRASSSPTAASRRTPTSTARRTGRTCSSTRSPTRSCSPGSWAGPTRPGARPRAAACILERGPASQERWENANGYSPATIGAEIAGLVCAAEIAERNGAPDAAAALPLDRRRLAPRLDNWTLTTNGPLSNLALLPATHHGRRRQRRHHLHDRRRRSDRRPADVVDPSSLEFVRFGVLPADDADIGCDPAGRRP